MRRHRQSWVALAGTLLCLAILSSFFFGADVSREQFSPDGPYPQYQRDEVSLHGGRLVFYRYQSHERVVWYGGHLLAPGTSLHARWVVDAGGAVRSIVWAVAYGGWGWTDYGKLFGRRDGVTFLAQLPLWPLAALTLVPAAVWLRRQRQIRVDRAGFPVGFAAAGPISHG